MTPWGWVAVGLTGALIALMWVEYANTPEDTSWTDPQQPPTMLPLALGVSTGRIPRGADHCRDYPGSLAGWSGTVVGDC